MGQIKFNEKTILYGITPPKFSTLEKEISDTAKITAARVNEIKPTAIVVYDIQDESKRNSTPRPFAFLETIPPIDYAKYLNEYTDTPIILYNCVINQTKNQLIDWIAQAEKIKSVKAVVFAGGQIYQDKSSKITLIEAYKTFNEQKTNLQLGGITIAERHLKSKVEHLNILRKVEQGCSFFISQAVYNDDITIWMLNDLKKECVKQGIKIPAIMLTFAPCGNERTLEFMKWLGIFIPGSIRQRILNSDEPTFESVDICYEKFLSIITVGKRLGIEIGANIESVSKIKKEIEAAKALFYLVKVKK